jgi:hypothetical protein
LVAGFKRDLFELVSPDKSSSLSTDVMKGSERLWANFPVTKPLWRKMKSFRVDIDIAGLPQAISATKISENFILGFDMVRRVAEYLETIRPGIRTLDVIINISHIRAYPVAVISRFINAILDSFSNLWSIKQLRIYLAIRSIQDSLFNLLEGPLHQVEESFRRDASTLQNNIKELRMKVARYERQTSPSPDKYPPEKPKMRNVLYHLEKVIQVLHHPLILSFIRREVNQLKEAHTSAIIAQHRSDVNRLRDAYSRISQILGSYTRIQGNIARSISQQVQNKLHELNLTDGDPAEFK